MQVGEVTTAVPYGMTSVPATMATSGASARRAQFSGHLVSDFYVGYNDYAGKHQRCWAHLLRDLHNLKDAHPHEADVLGWAQAVQAIYDAAQAWLAAHAQAPPSRG